ncbi:MAG: hypothetical protein F6K42_11500 [Leptolyngbya sp. SIO1D8]|nr:hypothetical protein [Leptolyngbya sp. SIO1D8]
MGYLKRWTAQTPPVTQVDLPIEGMGQQPVRCLVLQFPVLGVLQQRELVSAEQPMLPMRTLRAEAAPG